MTVALIALFAALGGTATAASVLIRSSKQIKNGVVTGADLKNKSVGRADLKDQAVDSAKIKNGAVTLDDLQSSARSAIQNAATSALEAFRHEGPNDVAAGQQARVATLSNIPPGVYAIIAKTVLTAKVAKSGLLGQGQTVSGHCVLEVGGDQDESRSLLGGPGANAPGEVNMQITRTYGTTGEASLTCDVQDASWNASNTSIIAIRMGSAPRQEVSG
jgi:hypothetical protein